MLSGMRENMETSAIGDRVAIVGIGTLDFGQLYGTRDQFRSAETLGARALSLALEDAGLRKDDIDGMVIMRIDSYEYFATILGMRPAQLRYLSQFPGHGRFSGVAMQTAMMLIATGMARTVACVYGNNGRSVQDKYGGGEGRQPTSGYEYVYGMTSPGAAVAHSYSRYMSTYHVPDGALAPFAIANRNHAKKNPHSVMRGDLSVEQYMNARFIAEPLRLFDYCLINDGAVAVILTTPERARDLRKPAVMVKSAAASVTVGTTYQAKDNFWASGTDTARELWNDSGIGPADIDVAAIYDNFTATTLFSIEAFGFCERGTGWEWARDGRIEIGGELPLNTSGGHTSEGYMQGWNHIAELVRQLRGESANQVENCELGQFILLSPITTSHILARS